MPVYVYPSVQYAKAQVWDGSDWQNLLGTSEGKVYVIPPSFEADLGTFTATGAGEAKDTVIGFDKWTWVQTNDASSTAPDIRLQGSIDGTNWFDLDTSTTIGSEMRHVVNKPVRYIRAYVSDMGDASSITVKVFAIR